MDGSFAIAETYIRIGDAAPTSRTLERRAAQLEEFARSAGLEMFGHGLILEVLVEPGSIIERCKVYLPIAAAVVTIVTGTAGLLDRDYGPDGQIRQNVERLHRASKAFSDQILARVLPDHPSTSHDENTDRSVITTRRKTLTLGKLKRVLDAAKDLEADPKSKELLREFQRRVSLLLSDCDSEEERAQLINALQQDEPSQMALIRGFGEDSARLAQAPPDASHYAPRRHDKVASSRSTERKRLTAAERRALPKPVVRRFSI